MSKLGYPVCFMNIISREMDGIPVQILLLKKKNSSGFVRNGKIILRISSRLSTKEKNNHIESLFRRCARQFKKEQSGKITCINPLSDIFEKDFWRKNLRTQEFYMGKTKIHTNDEYDINLKVERERKNILGRIDENRILLHMPSLAIKKNRSSLESIIYKLIGYDKIDYVDQIICSINKKYFRNRYNRVTIRHTVSRWGSCSSKRNINISAKLLFLPYKYLEYVCVHELAHLKHLNHSKKFWELVEQALPDYKQTRKELNVIQ